MDFTKVQICIDDQYGELNVKVNRKNDSIQDIYDKIEEKIQSFMTNERQWMLHLLHNRLPVIFHTILQYNGESKQSKFERISCQNVYEYRLFFEFINQDENKYHQEADNYELWWSFIDQNNNFTSRPFKIFTKLEEPLNELKKRIHIQSIQWVTFQYVASHYEIWNLHMNRHK